MLALYYTQFIVASYGTTFFDFSEFSILLIYCFIAFLKNNWCVSTKMMLQLYLFKVKIVPVGVSWWLGKIPLSPSNIIDCVLNIMFLKRLWILEYFLLIKIRRDCAVWKGSVTCDVIDSDRIGRTGARWRWDRVTGTRSVSGPLPASHSPPPRSLAPLTVKSTDTQSHVVTPESIPFKTKAFHFPKKWFLHFSNKWNRSKDLRSRSLSLKHKIYVKTQLMFFWCIHLEYNKR